MTVDEPSAIAARLATCLGVAVERPGEANGGVLLLRTEELDAQPAERLGGAAAVVVAGRPQDAAGADLEALAERVAQHALQVLVAAFATVPGDGGRPVEAPVVVAGRRDDDRLAELLEAGPHALTLDAAVDVVGSGSTDAPAARVCIVSFEVAGMTGGGIGTASTALAETLARRGHDVTLLFTGWQEPGAEEANARWQAHYAQRSVALAFVRTPGARPRGTAHHPANVAFEVYRWLLAAEPFDVVHLPENMGHGAYAQLAKRQGSAFARTTFVIGTHGPTRWAAEANRVALTRDEFLVNDALERVSVRLADVLLGPSRYLHDHLRARGWELPRRVHVQPYALPSAVRDRVEAAAAARPGGAALPDELVFFGRLETRKGVATLCDALDLLAGDDRLPRFSVTFLGPVAEVHGRPADAYIAERARRWPWRWEVVSDRDQDGAAAHLSRPGVLAVMPSTVDNAPNTVSEAVALGVPLVAARSGGTGELIAAVQRDEHTFGSADPLLPVPLDRPAPAIDPAPLAELLRRQLTVPTAAARAPVSADAVERAYDRWHRAQARAAGADRLAAGRSASAPSLAVCLLFDGDEQTLERQLAATAGDDAELIVADLRTDRDGAGPEPAARRGVAVVAPERPGHAAQARTAALAATAAELIAFVGAEAVPDDLFVERLRRAAATGADVYGCAVETGDDDDPVRVTLPGPPLAGLTGQAFAVGPYAIGRSAIAALGGFASDAAGAEADHELLNRAALAGLRIEPIPEVLARLLPASRPAHDATRPSCDADAWLRVERPFANGAAPLGDLPALLRGAREELDGVRAALKEAHAAYEQRLAEQRQWIDNLESTSKTLRDDRAVLVEQVRALEAEADRLRRLNEELSESAAHLAVRTLRSAGKRLERRLRD